LRVVPERRGFGDGTIRGIAVLLDRQNTFGETREERSEIGQYFEEYDDK
jgi:hypothetical protein